MATSPTTPPDLDALPTAPSRSSPTTFRVLMDAFLAAMVTFRTQMVTLATWVETTATQVYNNAGEAATSASNATSTYNATVVVKDASVAAKDDAETAQAAAEAVAGATVWISAGSYTLGDLHWSPINSATYRAKTTHSGETTDPSADTTNWGPILTLASATDATFEGTTTFNGAFVEETYNLTGTVIDPANGTAQRKTLSGTTTFTESLVDGESVFLRIENGDTYTVNWPTGTWVGGSAPLLTSDDQIALWHEDSRLFLSYIGSVE